MPSKLSTHVLDLTTGKPAVGMKIELHRLSVTGSGFQLLKTVSTNEDGRPSSPLLSADEMAVGCYQLIFDVGTYFSGEANVARRSSWQSFLDLVPIWFKITDSTAGYHVPLLCTPWAYSTYRGS